MVDLQFPEYCNMRRDICLEHFKRIEQRLNTFFETQGSALTLARNEMERRLEGMNEFRAQLNSQANTFQSISGANEDYEAINNKLADLNSWKSFQEGKAFRASTISIVALGVSVIVVLISLLSFFGGLR